MNEDRHMHNIGVLMDAEENIIYVQYLIMVQDCYQIYRWIIRWKKT